MLLPDLYQTISFEQTADGKHQAVITVNPKHEIFNGHFPGNPVMPGVCMMQIIKELTERAIGSGLILSTMSNVKFMALINPDVNPELKLDLDISETPEGLVKVRNTTYLNETAALKFSGTFKKPLL